MASEQARRENKVTEREVEVEKDRVPKMTSHFEAIAKDSQQGGESGATTHFVPLSDKGSNMVVSDEGEGETKMKRTQMPQTVGKFVMSSGGGKEGAKGKEHEKASLEDIHGYRANAQQKSMDTIRAAEERYNKAKEGLSHGRGGEQMEGKGRESGVRVTRASTTDKGQRGHESGGGVGGGRIHGGVGAAPALGQEARGKLGRESGAHGQESDVGARGRIHGGAGAGTLFGQEARGGVGESEKAQHANLLAAGGGEMKERKGQGSVGLGQGGQKAGASVKDTAGERAQIASDYMSEKGRETGQVASQKGQEAKDQAGRAKDYTMGKAGEAKDTAAEKARRASEYATEKGKEAGNVTLEKASEAKDTAAEKAQRASQYATEKGRETGNTAAEKAARAKDYTMEKASEAKDTAAEKAQRASQYVTKKGRETGNTAAEQAARAKDYTYQKALEAKDIAAEKAQVASQYAAEKGKAAGNIAAEKGQVVKEQTVSMTGKAAEKAGEVAEYLKEVTVEGGKEAAHYAEVAAEKAVAAGWTAAHFTTEKLVQGTKAVAGTVEGAVGYTGHKAVEVGSKAVDLTKEKAAVAADTVVGYTARKKEEAQRRDQEMHQGGEEEQQPGFMSETKGVSGGFGEEYTEGRRDVGEEEYFGGGEGGRDQRYVQEEGVGAGGVLGAIGETIVEIAQTTKNMVIGDEPPVTQERETDYMRQEHGKR